MGFCLVLQRIWTSYNILPSVIDELDQIFCGSLAKGFTAWDIKMLSGSYIAILTRHFYQYLPFSRLHKYLSHSLHFVIPKLLVSDAAFLFRIRIRPLLMDFFYYFNKVLLQLVSILSYRLITCSLTNWCVLFSSLSFITSCVNVLEKRGKLREDRLACQPANINPRRSCTKFVYSILYINVHNINTRVNYKSRFGQKNRILADPNPQHCPLPVSAFKTKSVCVPLWFPTVRFTVFPQLANFFPFLGVFSTLIILSHPTHLGRRPST